MFLPVFCDGLCGHNSKQMAAKMPKKANKKNNIPSQSAPEVLTIPNLVPKEKEKSLYCSSFIYIGRFGLIACNHGS